MTDHNVLGTKSPSSEAHGAVDASPHPAPPGSTASEPRVAFAAGQLLIDGRPRILLTASVFPFRIPRDQWAERLATIASLGYDAVDVYIPWNFHELRPATWDFTGQRDVEHFLQLCAAQGLLVLARPGPYICSEWDGGALPAWLTTTAGLRLRQHDPAYLGQVRRWFDQVLPVLERNQLGREGTIALVQIENELDFFDCDDPEGYIGALRDMMRAHGIVVPLIACAGQGDIARAGGRTPGVAPAVNLYPSDESLDIENQAEYYARATHDLGMPLLVTETNRLHRTLKRLLVAGGRLIGPYLQASGWNTGYTTAVNNWGDPLAFMTHDYDFGGVMRPDGTVRPDGAEATLLAGLIHALGSSLAAGIPQGPARGVEHDLAIEPRSMSLGDGGELISVTNLRSEPASVELRATGPCGTARLSVPVAAGVCLLLVRELPVAGTGATLVASTGELTLLDRTGDRVRLRLTGRPDAGPVVALLDGTTAVLSTSGSVVTTLEPGDGSRRCRIVGGDGEAVLRTTSGELVVCLSGAPDEVPSEAGTRAPEDVTVVQASGATDGSRGVRWSTRQEHGPARSLEEVGSPVGSGRYTSRQTLPDDALGVVLRAAADVVQVRAPHFHPGWMANGGGDLFVPLAPRPAEPQPGPAGVRSPDSLTVVTRTWGHSNFDDARLPSLRLGSQRGIVGALAVTAVTLLDEGWWVESAMVEGQRLGPRVGRNPRPRVGFGSWMSSTFPQTIHYSRHLSRAELGGSGESEAAIRADGLAARIDVQLDGRHVGTLTPYTPLLWLGTITGTTELELVVHRGWGEPPGSVSVLTGTGLHDWGIATCEEADLARDRDQTEVETRSLPLEVPPGTSRWVRVSIPRTFDMSLGVRDVVLRLQGRGLHVTCLAANRLLARVWTDAPEGAQLRGGRGDLILVPASSTPATLDLLLEATSGEPGVLTGLRLHGPIDL